MSIEPSEDEVHKLAVELAVVLDLAPRRPPWDGLHKIARHVLKMHAPRPEDVEDLRQIICRAQSEWATSSRTDISMVQAAAEATIARYGAPPPQVTLQTIEGITVVVFPEHGKWIGQCLERDICAQADTRDELVRRLRATIEYERSAFRHKSGSSNASVCVCQTRT